MTRCALKGYETGAVDFLHKPVAPQVILSKVNVFIELYQQRQLLKARNEALERSLKLNETMAAVLTHDLRTPLSAILLCRQAGAGASRGQCRCAADPEAPGSQHPAHGADGRAAAGLSRIRSGGLRLQASACDLADVTRAVVAEAGSAHGHARIIWTCRAIPACRAIWIGLARSPRTWSATR
jgi:signal transduction histidine kinase